MAFGIVALALFVFDVIVVFIIFLFDLMTLLFVEKELSRCPNVIIGDPSIICAYSYGIFLVLETFVFPSNFFAF